MLVRESIADVYAEKEFYIPNEERAFDVKYKAQNIDKDRVIVSYSDMKIVKNPKTLENFPSSARGVIDLEGNLYMVVSNKILHPWMLITLWDKGFIEKDERWYMKQPSKFLTVQRVRDTNKLAVGESNIEGYQKYAEFFMIIAKEINPQFTFIPKLIKFVSEGVADVYAEKEFYFPEPHEKFERKYQTREAEENYRDNIIYKENKPLIIINPSTLQNLPAMSRGVIDKDGNLFFDLTFDLIHKDILKILLEMGFIDEIPSMWTFRKPTEFLTVQRFFKTNKIAIGESTSLLFKNGSDYKDKALSIENLSDEEIFKIYNDFLNKSRKLNPQLEFITQKIDRLGEKSYVS